MTLDPAVNQSTASVESALATWERVRGFQGRHRAWCTACEPNIARCFSGQFLAERERAAWAAVRQARTEVER